MTYKDQLEDDRWHAIKNACFQRDKNRCIVCNEQACILHCHHWKYGDSKKAWEYSLDNFATLCDWHHGLLHGKKNDEVITHHHYNKELSSSPVKRINDKIRDCQKELKKGTYTLEPQQIIDLLRTIDSLIKQRENQINDDSVQHISELIVQCIRSGTYRQIVEEVKSCQHSIHNNSQPSINDERHRMD
jgi:hypothetical protein